MKPSLLILVLGALFFAVCIGVLVFTTTKPQEEVPEVQTSEVATTTPEQTALVFTEEGRQPSVPANAQGAAPVCDRGVADYGANAAAMSGGTISAYTKESVIQAILKRNEILKSGSAACIRTYLRTGFVQESEDWAELETMSDERLVVLARFMAVMGTEDGETAQEFRARMLANDSWVFADGEMKVSFTEPANGGTVTTYQQSYLLNGAWY